MRQNILPDPSQKVFEAFMDFSGGLNTEITNEKLKVTELPVLLNADLSGRSSARLRSGRVNVLAQAGVAQGTFFYYRDNQVSPDIVLAIAGRLYVKLNNTNVVFEVPMKDGVNPFTFQQILTVEAVQYRQTMFIATGSKLVELAFDTSLAWQAGTDYATGAKVKVGASVYSATIGGHSGTVAPAGTGAIINDGTVTWSYVSEQWHASVVVPYTPTVMEAIYIGTNGLAENPDAYIQDGVSVTANVEAIGVKPQYRTAAVNRPINMTAYINRPSGYAGTVDYKWEYRKSSETAWVMAKDFTASASTNAFSFDTSTSYDVRVTIRKTGDATTPTSTQQYVLTSYEVKQVEDRTAVSPVDAISHCRRILLHWDRLLLYGDDKYPYQMYISDLQNGRYFPVSNTINFDIGKQEPITAAVRFQDMLVIFSKTTIQTLLGKSTDDYRRFQIHDGIGCIAGWTAKVVGNNVYFLSHEGVYALKPNQYKLETMNVSRIDTQVKSEMPTDADACAVVTDSMYWLCFPQKKIIYRHYYETGVWSKDASGKLDIIQFLLYGEDVYNLTVNGNIYKHDPTVYTDAGELYDMIVETKFLDLSASFNYKKLKKLYVLAKHYGTHNVEFFVTVQADSALVLNPDSGHAEVLPDGTTVWVDTTTPNFHFYTGTSFGGWVMGVSPLGEISLSVQKASIRGKCRRVKVRYRAGGGRAAELFGFGLEFKLKKP